MSPVVPPPLPAGVVAADAGHEVEAGAGGEVDVGGVAVDADRGADLPKRCGAKRGISSQPREAEEAMFTRAWAGATWSWVTSPKRSPWAEGSRRELGGEEVQVGAELERGADVDLEVAGRDRLGDVDGYPWGRW